MHSSTLDTPPSVLLTDHTIANPSSCSPKARDGGELLVAVATLVTEGRIPIVQSTTKRCGLQQQLTNNTGNQQQHQGALGTAVGGGGGGGAKTQQHQRGFYEGPHCSTSSGMVGGSSPHRGGGTGGGGGGGGSQRMGREHCCNPTDALCQKYEKVRSEVLNLWQKGIPLCVEVFLKHTCSCDVPLDDENGSLLLLERWYLSVSHFRTPTDISSPSHSSIPTTFNNFNQLISAIRSQLYFSQISAWLSTSTYPTPPAPLSFHYRLAIPGETFDTSTFTRQPTLTHTFPSTDLGNGLLLNIQLESLPRVERIPVVKCPKCDVGVEQAADGEVVDGGRRSTSPGEGTAARQCALFDDRMHTRCTLKGKHRCDDLDDFDNNLLTKTEHQILGGKYKRLCHNETVEKRSPQRATFSSSTSSSTTSTPSRRLSATSTTSCDCQQPQQQLPSTSASNQSNSSSNNTKCFNDGFDGAADSEDSSPAMVNKGIRFCYQAFGEVLLDGPGFDGGRLDGTILDGVVKGGVEELNQNEKRNSAQSEGEEPNKAPKLDLGDRATPPNINVLEGPFDLSKQQPQRSSLSIITGTAINRNKKGDFLVSSILRNCGLQQTQIQSGGELPLAKESSLLSLQQSNGNNINNNAVGKCDVKCVQRLGRIGTSILHGCARALQTVSDTTTTTNGDIFNLSQNSKVNNTVYVDTSNYNSSEQDDKTACYKPCKIRDISNTQSSKVVNSKAAYQSLSIDQSNDTPQLINQQQPSTKYQSVRRKLSFSNDEATTTTKHPDSPIPPTNRFTFAPSSHHLRQKLSFDHFDSPPATITSNGANVNAAIEIPSPLDKAQFRKSLDNAASMVFHARTGLPLTSSPAPVRRGNTHFDYDSSIDSVSAIKSALFSGSLSTDDDSESDGSIVSPCSPDAFLTQSPVKSYYSHATVLTKSQQQQQQEHNHQHTKNSNSRTALPSTNSSSAVQHHHHSNSNRRKTTSSSHLLGTFEESALNGRLEPAATVHGFKAELGASGSFVPPHRIVPVTVFFYTFGDSDKVTSPYLGHINLGKKGYNVPRTGTVQVTLFNPLGTVVKMFVIMYDLADMPNNAQTFIRQRTLYMPTNCKDPNLEWGPKWLRYLIHLRFMSSKSGKIYLHSDIRMIIFRKCDLDTANAHGMDMCYELRSFTHMPHNPKYSPRK